MTHTIDTGLMIINLATLVLLWILPIIPCLWVLSRDRSIADSLRNLWLMIILFPLFGAFVFLLWQTTSKSVVHKNQ